jgi:hypothetical protein
MSQETFTPEIISENEVTDTLFVTLDGGSFQRSLDLLGLTIDSSESEIISTIAPAVLEQFGIDIREDFKARKDTPGRNIFIIPASTAG